MKIETKFDIGTEVWVIVLRSGEQVCTVCHGVGSIRADCVTYHCERCCGEGTEERRELKWEVVRYDGDPKHTVAQIDVHCQMSSPCTTYFAVAPGDPDTGRWLPESEIFPTFAEAEAVVDRRNAEIMENGA